MTFFQSIYVYFVLNLFLILNACLIYVGIQKVGTTMETQFQLSLFLNTFSFSKKIVKSSNDSNNLTELKYFFLGLGQQRMMPSGGYGQEKACEQEDKLIGRLQQIELDTILIDVLCQQANLILDGKLYFFYIIFPFNERRLCCFKRSKIL